MAVGDSLGYLPALGAEFPSANFAQHDAINGAGNERIVVIDFGDDTVGVDEVCFWRYEVPQAYGGGIYRLSIRFTMSTAVTGDVLWQAQFKQANDLENYVAKAYPTGKSVTKAVPASVGTLFIAQLDMDTAALRDNVAAGDQLSIRLLRLGTSASDTASGDAELHGIGLREA